MGILDSASSQSVSRGYDYYKEGRVVLCQQISNYEFMGKIQGNDSKPYNVVININHPRKSTCNCPFAKGRQIICKHMVALFFYVLPEEAKDYEDWLVSDYYDENDDDEDDEDDYYEEDYYDYDYDYYDKYNRYSRYNDDFIKPIFFDEILNNFVNNLSEDEIKNLFVQELKRNERYTFEKYLQKEYEKYLLNSKNTHALIDKINSRFKKLSDDYDFNYNDFSVQLLNKSEKKKIKEIYESDDKMRNIIDKIFLVPDLATYDDYKWITNFYKNNVYANKEKISKFCKDLTSLFNLLKHYSIKNTTPKSNILITLYILNNYTIEETSKLLIKNSKYDEFIDYILNNTNNLNLLYKNFYDNIKKEKYLNYNKIAEILKKFYYEHGIEDIEDECDYYSFLGTKNINYLEALRYSNKFDKYINELLDKCKDTIILEKVYIVLEQKENLFKLLCNKENEYRLIANIEVLKDEYTDKLFNYFKNRIYEVLSGKKDRESYKKVASLMLSIKKLNNGEQLVNNTIKELKYSEYAKRTALFDEIEKAINR